MTTKKVNTASEKKTKLDGAKKIDFLIAPSTLKKFDRQARRVGTSRAQLLRDLVQKFLKESA